MSAPLTPALLDRAAHACELCGATDDLAGLAVPPGDGADHTVVACPTCIAQVEGGSALDAKHWFCLQDAIWKDVPAVQVVGWRLLKRLGGETWAADLLDQVFLEDDVMAWAQAGLVSDEAADGAPARVLDSNGVELKDGDSVTLIKDLDVKGAGFTAKRGTLVKGIRLGDVAEHVEGRVNGTAIYLKTAFLKKVV